MIASMGHALSTNCSPHDYHSRCNRVLIESDSTPLVSGDTGDTTMETPVMNSELPIEEHASAAGASTLDQLITPCLILDATRMERNIARLKMRLNQLGVALRPHLKTTKCVEVAHRVMTSPTGPATVSTLQEASRFAEAGVRDILYAVGIAPSKLPRVLELRKQGVDIAVILDSAEQAQAVADASRDAGTRIPALIEIDCDGHRSGVAPADKTA